MSKKGYKISISSPCHENWINMSVVEKGKFCSSCQKTVIDFTSLSDHEIYMLLSKSSGSLCGRIEQSQMERTLVPLNTKTNPFYKIYSVMAGFFIMSSLHQKTFADNGKAKLKSTFIKTSEIHSKIKANKEIPADSLYIEGKVRDAENQDEVIAAIILIDSDSINSVATDSDGNFRIKIPSTFKMDTLHIQIHSIGYKEKDYFIPLSQLPIKTEFYLFPAPQITMGAVVHYERVSDKRNWWNPFGKKKPRYQRVP